MIRKVGDKGQRIRCSLHSLVHSLISFTSLLLAFGMDWLGTVGSADMGMVLCPGLGGLRGLVMVGRVMGFW